MTARVVGETSHKQALPSNANAALAGFYVAVNGFQFFLLPLWLLPLNALWAWALLPLAFFFAI